jgi:hypothetical protein
MSLHGQPQLVALISMVLYAAVPLRMIAKGRFMLAGLLMLFAAQLPIIWQVRATNSEMPGFALLTVLLSIPAALLLALRAAYLLVTKLQKRSA